MKSVLAVLAALLAGCSAVAVYPIDSPPTAQCMLIAPVKYSLLIPADSKDQGIPLKELRERVLDLCKDEVRDAGGNALVVKERTETDSAKAVTLSCSGVAYECP